MKTKSRMYFLNIITVWVVVISSSDIIGSDNVIKAPSVGDYVSVGSANYDSNCVAVGHFLSLGNGPTIGISAGNREFENATIVIDKLLKGNYPDKINVSYTMSDKEVSTGLLPKRRVSYIFFLQISPAPNTNYLHKALPNTDKNMKTVTDLLAKSQH